MKNSKLYAYAPGLGAHDASFAARRCAQRVRGLEGNISIGLCVVLFVTSHSAAIGKELSRQPQFFVAYMTQIGKRRTYFIYPGSRLGSFTRT